MTWMNNHTRNDFKTFWDTLSPLLRGDYRIWPRWQSEHFQYLLQLTFDAVTKANCGVEERLRASWTDHELPFALYLRSFTHESLSTSSPLGEALSFDLSGLETPLAVCSQLGEDGTIVLIDNPAGLAMMTSALPADDRLLAIATDETWAESVRQLIERADLVVLTASLGSSVRAGGEGARERESAF
jgi:hypothetical protein